MTKEEKCEVYMLQYEVYLLQREVYVVDKIVASVFQPLKSFHVHNVSYRLPIGWGGHLFRRFWNMFSKSSPCLLVQHGSCSKAQRPVELSENSLQNLRNKWPPHPVFSVHNLILAQQFCRTLGFVIYLISVVNFMFYILHPLTHGKLVQCIHK